MYESNPLRIDNSSYLFTVFTPTYNRAHTLDRVYESLRKQTFSDFEWLIVDDGSTDNTRDLVKEWRKKAKFPIRYIRQPNQGKHIAFNRGVQEARGELFLNLDSDDSCVKEALERFRYHWVSIPKNKRSQFSAVTCLCVDQFNNLVGDRFPHDVFDSDSLEIRYKYKIKGEKWGFHRTEILRKFRFPEIEGQKYIPEDIVWHGIATQYKTRFINEPLRIYWTDTSSQSDQLTRLPDPSRNAVGLLILNQIILNNEIKYFFYAPTKFFLTALRYARFSFHQGLSKWDQLIRMTNNFARLLWGMMIVPGYAAYTWDKKKMKKRKIRLLK
ncbi:MAG: glycosyltransferase family 2 protein [Desulfitobacteriaceae bacterium]|nr:glycosyltransferase family 2 protein [Desulfitobacteriaceae bacterium]MDD4753918.1 glycosyltransferase family 2 protein [Desulfitobacteriaceae bacterium]